MQLSLVRIGVVKEAGEPVGRGLVKEGWIEGWGGVIGMN